MGAELRHRGPRPAPLQLAKSDPNDPLALDGKTLNGARRKDGTQVHLLSAFLHQQALNLAQIEVGRENQRNPRAQAPAGAPGYPGVMTADAMHSQRESPASGSRPTPSPRIKRASTRTRPWATMIFPPADTQCDKAHGRLETRTIQLSSALNGHLDFPYVGQLFRLTRERIDLPGGKPELEVLYGLTSLSSQPIRNTLNGKPHTRIIISP